MNVIRFLIAVVVMLIVMFFYEWIAHGGLLIEVYNQTPQLWRTQEEMFIYLPVNLGILVALAAWFVFVFSQIFPEGGVGKGFLFGLYFGVFAGLEAAASYYYLPIGAALAASWFVLGLIELLLCGAVVGAIYRKN